MDSNIKKKEKKRKKKLDCNTLKCKLNQHLGNLDFTKNQWPVKNLKVSLIILSEEIFQC